MLFIRHRQWSCCSLAVRARAWYWDLRQADSRATPSKSGAVLLDVERTQEPLIERILATRFAYESVSSAAAALLLGCDRPGTPCSRRPRGSDLTIGTAAGPGTVSDHCRAGRSCPSVFQPCLFTFVIQLTIGTAPELTTGGQDTDSALVSCIKLPAALCICTVTWCILT